jgi:hypothetical protein
MKPMSIYWIVWASVMFVSFAIPEFWALATHHPENTLSDNVWRLEKFLPGDHWYQWSAVHVLIGGALIVLFGWLIGHFVWGVWR